MRQREGGREIEIVSMRKRERDGEEGRCTIHKDRM